jgi:FemAB-related protein (PEP-CTERM system-associated)
MVHGIDLTRPEICLASPDDWNRWNSLVRRIPGASFCHLFEWFQVLRKAYGKTCYFLYAFEGEGWSGVLPLVHMKGPLTSNRLVSLPFLDQGGILAMSSDAAMALRDAAFELAIRLRASGIDLRGPNGFNRQPPTETRRYRLILRLEGSEERLWEAIGSKVRNQIRKSERSGLVTRRIDAKGLESFYTIFARNMRDLGSPVHSRRFFQEILSAFGSAASVYLVSTGDRRPVAGAISIRFGDTVAVPWASSLRSARADCPNHSLYWGILRDALESGTEELDFGRSSIGTGTFHFKKQWHARAEPLVWRAYNDEGAEQQDSAMRVDKHVFLANTWRRIPVSLANCLGPWLRRQISN